MSFTKYLFSLSLIALCSCACFAQNNLSRTDCPVSIFYGLNESHSTNWAQTTDTGLVGISYYNKESQNLMYKTIQANDIENEEIVTSGLNLEVSILLFDSAMNPHIFVATSDSLNQTIRHFYKNNNLWEFETVYNFMNEGGLFIYELTGDIDNNNKFHLLVLKLRSNPDSDDYYFASVNAHLYYLNNTTNTWQSELIQNYVTIWTLDEYAKMINRIDLKIDSNNNAHVIFGEQISAVSFAYPSRLRYTNKISGSWEIETAINYNPNTRDDGGWYPSLSLDNNNIPYVAASYVSRVPSGSAIYSKLLFAKRAEAGSWELETVCTEDAGYYGSDGRDYTGALNHLIFDNNNTPHLVFSDIASSHAGMNYWNLGNIRYAFKNNGSWHISTIYQQALPSSFFDATEMYGMCLLISNNPYKVQVIGQELSVTGIENYHVDFVHFLIEGQNAMEEISPNKITFQNYPNPFNPSTTITFEIDQPAQIKLDIYNLKGQKVCSLINEKLTAGKHHILWNGKDLSGINCRSGLYFCKMQAGSDIHTKKMIMLK